MKLGVLDYGAGNLRSVLNAFSAIEHPAKLISTPADFENIDTLVFPGQGAFGDSVRILKKNDVWSPLRQWLLDGRPYLGFCLGYQLLFEASEESPGAEGLGVVPGRVRRFSADHGLKIPHMGWNEACWEPRAAALHKGMTNPSFVYFVHSYYPDVEDQNLVACRTTYGTSFASGIIKPNLVAVQFHPEKSQDTGLTLLRNSLALFEH
jgi:glutamine amidotransferase